MEAGALFIVDEAEGVTEGIKFTCLPLKMSAILVDIGVGNNKPWLPPVLAMGIVFAAWIPLTKTRANKAAIMRPIVPPVKSNLLNTIGFFQHNFLGKRFSNLEYTGQSLYPPVRQTWF